MALKTPKVLAGPAEAGLDLVGNEQPACPLDGIDCALQETLWARKDAVAGEQRINNQRGRLDAMTAQVRDRRLDVACEALGQVGAVGVLDAWRRNQAHMLAEIDGHAQ